MTAGLPYSIQEITFNGLRREQAGDLGQLARVSERHQQHHGVFWLNPEAELKNFRRTKKSHWGVIYEGDDSLIATLSACEDQRDETVVNLNGVFVMPDHRGQGLATKMCVLAKSWAKQKGFVAVHAYTSVENKASIALWEKQNFCPWAESLKEMTWLDKSQSRVRVYRCDLV